ncbi:cell envelope-related function transcriptional attenuator common domain-containing protein [Paraoerskovia marina]|uniref:Cell envelope-related function transcriptional attenuator common domain-containing protein n=2 Tax=Paraoerskovia marina TaxID=545619 RepID=A0A1H1Q306_9CELL|nr:cell envelope-related function transcriptional attenuator common domain-containing protein [Paraoerskovia marina]
MNRMSSAAATCAVAALLLTGCTSGASQESAPSPTSSPTPTATASPKPTETPTPTPTGPEDPLPDGDVDVLLIGNDSRDPESLTGNADTIMLAHVPEDRENLYLISFTRDMWVPIPGLGEGKINSAFSRGGTPTLTETVSELLGGVDVDYTMQTNFAGFIALTRALDGFEVDNKYATSVTVKSTGREVVFDEGMIELENTDGLIYTRERKRLPLGDLDRTERQRAAVTGMLAEIAEQAQDPEDLAELMPVLLGNVKVTGDLDLADFTALAELSEELGRDDVVGLMVPITGFGTKNGASVNLVDEAQTADLGAAIRSDSLDAYVERYGTDYAP